MRILMLEAERKLAGYMQRHLMAAQHTVDLTYDYEAAWTLATGVPYDLIILDQLVPGQGGLDVCRRLRAEGNMVPILICSVRRAIDDCIAGFDAGADDYLVKPFAMEEFLARVHALGRRERAGCTAIAPDGECTAGSVTEAPIVKMRRAHSLSAYLQHAWAAALHGRSLSQ